MTSAGPPTPPATEEPASPDPMAMLRTRSYLQLLVLAGLVGIPVSAVAYGYLKLVGVLQNWLFTSLPKELGFAGTPLWWPLPLLAVAGVLVGATIIYLPGSGVTSRPRGSRPAVHPHRSNCPGSSWPPLATLSLAVVLGPEAPLIAIGGGLGMLAVRLAKRDAPPTAAIVIASAGSFAAISTLLGSPILGAFLLMEASGLGGPLLGLILVPGLLAAGVGTLIFVGLDSLTGFGTFSLAIPGLPPSATRPWAMFGWAIVFGLVAPLLGTVIRLLGLALQPIVERRMLLLMPVIGLGVAGLAIAFAEGSGRNFTEVLFSGQSALPPLVLHAAGWTVGSLVLLVACKSAGLRALAVQLPGRTGVPLHVHRRRRRCGRLPPPGHVPGPRGGHGHRGHDHRDAQAPPHGHAAGHGAAGQ